MKRWLYISLVVFTIFALLVLAISGCQANNRSVKNPATISEEELEVSPAIIYGKGEKIPVSKELADKLIKQYFQMIRVVKLERSKGSFPDFRRPWENGGIAVRLRANEMMSGGGLDIVFIPLEPTTNALYINDVLFEVHNEQYDEASTLRLPDAYDEALAGLERALLDSGDKRITSLWKTATKKSGAMDIHLQVPDVAYDDSVYRAHMKVDNHGSNRVSFNLQKPSVRASEIAFPFGLSIMEKDIDRARLIQQGAPVVMLASATGTTPGKPGECWPSLLCLNPGDGVSTHQSFVVNNVKRKSGKPLRLEATWLINGQVDSKGAVKPVLTDFVSAAIALREK